MPSSAGGALGVAYMLRGRGRGAGRGGDLGEVDEGGVAAGTLSGEGDDGLVRGAGVGAVLEALESLLSLRVGGGRRLGSTSTFPI